jgi:dTDP-4-amino-4,6-dideoxygalactose transaminase
MSVPFLDLRAQYESVKEEIAAAVQEVIDHSAFALGPAVERFERAFADYCRVHHCVGVNSGTAALTLLLRAYGIGKGDEVITVANTFFATVEAMLHVGAIPVLVDCEEETALIDVTKIEAAITKTTKAIIPVHLFGQCADMDAINGIAKKHRLIVIEDACQAHGALYGSTSSPQAKGRKAGSLGRSAAFSFYPGKNLGAFGEAGAVVTNDAEIANIVRMLRDHGQSQKYHHDLVGWNERMDGIQGAVLTVKLQHLDAWNARRRAHAKTYQERLVGVGDLRFFETPEGNEHIYHLFVIRTSKRDALQRHLKSRGIETGIHYPVPIHLLPATHNLGWNEGDLPVAEKLSKEILSLPMFPELTERQIEQVCTTIKEFPF